jgi:hypothetical protein
LQTDRVRDLQTQGLTKPKARNPNFAGSPKPGKPQIKVFFAKVAGEIAVSDLGTILSNGIARQEKRRGDDRGGG